MDPPRQPQGTAFALRDAWAWRDFATLARDGEALGFRALFLPEIAGRDVFAALAALAGETPALLLGSGIVPMGSRAPPADRDGGRDRPRALERADRSWDSAPAPPSRARSTGSGA